MIRPLIEAIHDYRMNNAQQNQFILPMNSYKMQYIDACSLIGAEQISSVLESNPDFNVEDAIESWNNHHDKIVKQTKKSNKALTNNHQTDYKQKIDEIFSNNGKGFFKSKEDSKDKEDYFIQNKYERDNYTGYKKQQRQNYNYHGQKYYENYHGYAKYKNDRY